MPANLDPLAGLSSASEDGDSSEDDGGDTNEQERAVNDGQYSTEVDRSQPALAQNTDIEGQDSSHKKKKKIRLEDLQRHGLRDGPSVLLVPKPHGETAEEFPTSWGRTDENKNDEPDSLEERERTRNAVTSGVEAMAANARKQVEMENVKRAEIRQENKERKQDVYTQGQKLRESNKVMTAKEREKRKRQRGQVSRGTNFVEEEKRSQRNYGVYSGFDG